MISLDSVMKKFCFKYFLFLTQLIFGSLAAGQTKTDSLLNVLATRQEDSLKQDARIHYVNSIRLAYDLSYPVINEGIAVAKNNNDYPHLIKLYNAAGMMYWQLGISDSSILAFEKSLSYAIYIKNDMGIASADLGLANVYKNTGDYAKAVKYALDSEVHFNLAGDTTGVARSCNVLGIIFRQQGDFNKSIYYYNRGLETVRSMNDALLESGFLSNIGVVYQEINNMDSAWYYHKNSLAIRLKLGDKKNIAISYGNIGSLFKKEQQIDSALFYTEKALQIFEETNYVMGMMEAYIAVGDIWQEAGNHQKAISMYKKAEELAKLGNLLPTLLGISKNMGESYQAMGKYKEATEYLALYIELKDSLFSTEESKEVQKMEIEFQYQQKHLADSLKALEREKFVLIENQKQKAINEAQTARFRIYLISGISAFVLVMAVALILYRNNKKQKMLNGIIAVQKATVEEKNKEITDSINYAKRIQEAILPPSHLVEKYLPESFILYKPKDIVAGDFYWFDYSAEDILISAADCTGHGVPGAMVSVVCSNALNRAVKEFGLRKPNQILDKVRSLVIETFEKSEKDVKDGMDAALVRITNTGSDKKEVQFSGAHNPLWIVRKDSKEIIELKADNQPIGKFIDAKPFTNFSHPLSTGDSLYIFTDGFADQFGGDKGKKFKTSNLQKLIISISEKPMRDQKIILEKTFEEWRGNLEQLDDVCVIGIRV